MKMLWTYMFFALVAYTQASDVLVFQDSNFESEVAKHSIILVEFYAPWCGHCKRLAPEYEKAATALKANDPPISIAKVDCTAETKVCEKHGVSGYPTLKVFKGGVFAFDYDGGRDFDGIVKYMRSKGGPTSKLLTNKADFDKFISTNEPVVVGFFKADGSELQKTFKLVADGLSEDFRFATTTDADILKSSGHEESVVIYLPKILHSKFEDKQKKYTGSASDSSAMRTWVEDNIYGLAGQRTQSNSKYFNKRPLVIAYYNVDYEKNPKGTNYWRNRLMKVGKEVRTSTGKSVYFAITSMSEGGELAEYGLESADNSKVHIVARDAQQKKYVMKSEFSMDTFKVWLKSFLDGKETPYLKSEPLPAANDESVKTVVAKNFDEIVNDKTKDVLIEFYAPWCGHCKSLAPKYEELAKKLSGEKEITIAKMDATANDVPAGYEVSGFPTLFFVPKEEKSTPRKYESGREVDDFVKFLAASSTNELSGFDRSGNAKKTDL